MEWWIIGIIMFSGFILLLAIGVPVGFALGFISFTLMFFLHGTGGLSTLISNSFSAISNFLLISCPLFIIMGICFKFTGIGENAFRAIETWMRRLPGGLAMATVGASTILGAASGFSATGIAVFGPAVLPEMIEKRNYNKYLALGALAGGAAIDVLIPPSVPFIMFGFLSGTSIVRLYYAGVTPGLMACLIFMIYIGIRVHLNPSLAPKIKSVVSFREKVGQTLRIWPMVLVICLVLGPIWGGIATSTEAAAIGGVSVFILSLVNKKLNWPTLKGLLVETAELNTIIFTILIGASAFTQVLAYTGFVEEFSKFVVNLPVPPWFVVALMMATNLFLGCFLDTMAIVFLTVPIYAPIIKLLGFDPVWFGVLFIINTEIGVLTPPVGMNLYTVMAIGRVPIEEASKAVAPYFFLYLLVMILVALFPFIATWLPNFIMG